MRTTLTLDSNILTKLKKYTHVKTKSKSVIIAIESYIKRKKLEEIIKLKGKINFDKEADELRHYER
jgi:uncharacterized metal-binding protein